MGGDVRPAVDQSASPAVGAVGGWEGWSGGWGGGDDHPPVARGNAEAARRNDVVTTSMSFTGTTSNDVDANLPLPPLSSVFSQFIP